MTETTHNPDQYMYGFRQIASSGKKKIGILIGAGAPVGINVSTTGKHESLIPDLAGLTKIIRSKLTEKELSVYENLHNSIENANLEKVLSRTRTFSEVIGTAEVYGLNSDGYKDLSSKICNLIRDEVNKTLPAERSPYTELVSWINGVNRKYGVELFTTNYDLLMEQALERSKTPYFDGFSGARDAFFDPSSISKNDLPSRWVRLWKLHGSIGWNQNSNGEVVRIPRSDNATMVYPSHVKYDETQAAPFSSLFERLKNFLLEPDTLLISTGFSYADAHISSKIIESLQANPSSALLAFQYKKLEEESQIKDMAERCSSVSAYCRNGAVINGVTAKWRLGQLPSKGWDVIRSEYYENSEFLLGDFARLARFLASAGGGYSKNLASSLTQVEAELAATDQDTGSSEGSDT